MSLPESDPRTRLEILIVGGNRTQTEPLRYLLENHGYAVTILTNGVEALEAAHARKPALVISDIAMPTMDGYTLCQRIKSHEELNDIPVVLLTSLSDAQDLVKGLTCGADSFIRKPYDETFLLSRLEDILANRKLRGKKQAPRGVEVCLGGERHLITAERQQILDLLISTYEEAAYINKELEARQEELAHSTQWLNGLYRLAKGLNRSTSEQKVAEQAVERAVDLPGVHASWIALREGDSDFRIAAARGLSPTQLEPVLQPGDCLCYCALRSGELNQATNILECGRLQPAHAHTRAPQYHASVPLWIGSRTLGVLNLAGPDPGLFSERDLRILHAVGNQIGAALERARLYEHLEKQVAERTAALTAEIKERKAAEEVARKVHNELEAKMKEVEKKNKEIEDFIFVISHDLKTPLVSIQGFVTEVRRALPGRLGEEGIFYFNRIAENANRIEALVYDILDFSRVERADTNLVAVNVADVVKAILERLGEQIKAKGVEVRIPQKLPVIIANPLKIDQVFTNLISNSLAYMGNPPHPHIEIDHSEDGDHWLFYVRDSGIGISREYHQKIFEIFERLPEAKEAHPKGTGIGLAIAKRIVEFHGGRIWMESEVGYGSTFYFVLAKNQVRAGAAAKAGENE